MEESYKRYIKVYGIIILFMIYIVALVFNDSLWGNILSPLVAFSSALIIWSEFKKVNTHKWNWITLFSVAVGWGISDLAWLITEEVLLIDPNTLPIFMYLYLICNIMIAISCGIYFYYNLKKWNTALLLMDIIVLGTLVLLSIWIIMFSKSNITSFFNAEYISTFLYLFFDFISISSILIMYVYANNKSITKTELIVLSSVIIYVVCDLYYIYLTFTDQYVANTIFDGVFILPIVLLAFAAMNESRNPTPIKSVRRGSKPENLGKFRLLKWLLVVPCILYFIGTDNLFLLVNMVILILVYTFVRKHVELSIKSEYYLRKEKSINDMLDSTVKARTKELIETNKVLENLSKRDPLTGFYNRRYFIEQIDSLIGSAEKKSFALFFMDLDRFKSINDTHGHEMGDNVLIETAERLRAWSPPSVTIARAGGDEFAVLIEGEVSEEILTKYAEEIINICEKPIIIPPYTLHIGISIGISIFPLHSNERETLMRYADIAMYQLKKNYIGQRFTIFDKSLSDEIQRKHKVELLLQDADFDKEFELYYQPQYRASDDTLVGMEALIRWNNPKEGQILPSEFIPIAEETSLIIKIGEWVFDESLKRIKYWNSKYNLDLKMGINISPKQIDKSNFIKGLLDKIQKSGVKTDWIELEITESSAMTSDISMEDIFSYFGDFHINMAIDDFGTGYSSLSYIKRFHIDRLKIAKELIDNIASDDNTLLIVKAIIMMTKGMGINSIAEGVEDQSQLNILRDLKCDDIQGYIYGRPVPADVFEKEHIEKMKF